MRTRAMLSFAVIALLAIMPGPVSAEGRPAADFPGVSLLVRVTTVFYAGTGADAAAPADLGGPCPKATTCTLHALSDVRRKVDDTGKVVIPFAYNDGKRRELRAQDESTVRAALGRAMGEWSRWNSNIVFEDTGRSDVEFGATGEDGSCSDGVNVITWGRFDQNVLGAASTCLDRTSKIVRDTDLSLNVVHRWVDGVDRRPLSYDLQSIYTHELGHWLQLQQPDPFFGSRQTMYASAQPNEIFKRTLALGDVVGIQKAYPCGEGDSCPRTGIVDD